MLNTPELMTTPTTLNIMGGISPLLWLIFTYVGITYQRYRNRDIWSDKYKERQIENKQAQGKYALACAACCLSILVIENFLTSPEDTKFRLYSVRSLVMLYMIAWGFLLNKIKHASNHLATVDRLSDFAKDRKSRRQKVGELTFLNLPRWHIPEPYKGVPQKKANGKGMIFVGGNIDKVKLRTAEAIRAIDCIWLGFFSIVVPTVEFWVTYKSFGFVFGPLRIL